MKNHTTIRYTMIVAGLAVFMTIGLIHFGTLPAFSHGGKSHDGTGFSSLQAVLKATQLYDRLILSGKLDKEWEIGLREIIINTRQSADKLEYVVEFKRDHGDPDSVFFFFDQKGEYSGSNFTGE